jgi:hypothetical protein
MDLNDLNGKIAVKQKEISVERDQNKKYELQRQLQVLQLKKQIASFKKS